MKTPQLKQPALKDQPSLGINILWLVASRFGAQGLMVLFTLVLARRLGSAEFGEYAFMAAVVFAGNALTTFGTDMLLIREIAGRNDLSRLPPALVIQLFLSGVFIAITWAAAPLLPNQSPASILGLQIYSLALLPLAFFSIFTTALRGVQRMDVYMALNLAVSALQFAMVWALVRPGGSIVRLAELLLVVQCVGAVLGGFVCAAQIPGFWRGWRFSLQETAALARISAPIALIALIAILYQKMSIYMLSTLSGPEPTGWFSAALRVVEASKTIHLAVFTALFPAMAQASIAILQPSKGMLQATKHPPGDRARGISRFRVKAQIQNYYVILSRRRRISQASSDPVPSRETLPSAKPAVRVTEPKLCSEPALTKEGVTEPIDLYREQYVNRFRLKARLHYSRSQGFSRFRQALLKAWRQLRPQIQSFRMSSETPLLIGKAGVDTQPWIGSFQRPWKLLLAGAAAASLAIYLSAGPLIQILYGSEYAPAVVGLRLLIWVLIPFTVSTFFSLAGLAQGKEQTVMRVQLAGLVALAGLNAWWIPRWGLAGACLACVLAETLQALLYLSPSRMFQRYHLKISPLAAWNRSRKRTETGDQAQSGESL